MKVFRRVDFYRMNSSTYAFDHTGSFLNYIKNLESTHTDDAARRTAARARPSAR